MHADAKNMVLYSRKKPQHHICSNHFTMDGDSIRLQ